MGSMIILDSSVEYLCTGVSIYKNWQVTSTLSSFFIFGIVTLVTQQLMQNCKYKISMPSCFFQSNSTPLDGILMCNCIVHKAEYARRFCLGDWDALSGGLGSIFATLGSIVTAVSISYTKDSPLGYYPGTLFWTNMGPWIILQCIQGQQTGSCDLWLPSTRGLSRGFVGCVHRLYGWVVDVQFCADLRWKYTTEKHILVPRIEIWITSNNFNDMNYL